MKRSEVGAKKVEPSDDQHSQKSRLSEEQTPEKQIQKEGTTKSEGKTEDFLRALSEGGPSTQRVGSGSLERSSDEQIAVTSTQPDFRSSLGDLGSSDLASPTPVYLSTRPDFRSSLVESGGLASPTTSSSRVRQPRLLDSSLARSTIAPSSGPRDTSRFGLEPADSQQMSVFHTRDLVRIYPEEGDERPTIASSSRLQDTSRSYLEPADSQQMSILPVRQRHLSDGHSSEGREERVEIPTSHDTGDTSQQDRHFVTYTQRVIKELKIPEEDRAEFEADAKVMYDILKINRSATSDDDFEAAFRAVLSHAPKEVSVFWIKPGRTTGEWFGQVLNGGEKTRLETNNIRMSGELEVERRAREGKSTRMRRTTNVMVWRLNKPKYRLLLASTLGLISTLTPIAYDGGKVKPSDAIAAPINVAATYGDTAIFKALNYPWNLGATTLIWQGSSFVTSFAQKGIDKIGQHDNSTHGNLTNSDLANLLSEPFGNLTVGNSTIDQLLAGRLEDLTRQGLTFTWNP